MKTLDEVIKAMEMCIESPDELDEDEAMCPGCPYADADGNPECVGKDKEDALYYLKKYQRYQNTPSCNGHMILVDYFEESQKNEPLTWDELKTMTGKPIWVEYEGYTPDWEVIEYIGDTKWKWGEVIETHLSILHKEDQDKTWKAYRKETM